MIEPCFSYFSNVGIYIMINKKLNDSLLLLFSCQVMFNSLQPYKLQHARLPCPSLSPWACPNLHPLSQWPSNHLIVCCPLIQYQNLFQCIGSSHQVAKVLEPQLQCQSFQMNIQGWLSLGLTSLISLLSKGLSRVFSSSTDSKHQFLGTITKYQRLGGL